jgi:hypothetical protein
MANNTNNTNHANHANHELPHAYRTAPLKNYCDLCGDEAVMRCLRCGQPFCGLHAPAAGDRCVDCERVYRRTANRVSLGCTSSALMIGVASVVTAAWVSVPWAIGAAGLAFVGGWALTALGLRVARGRFLVNEAGDSPLLEGADFSIAPATEEDGAAPRRRLGGWSPRSRGELPSVPMYQRTYGVG